MATLTNTTVHHSKDISGIHTLLGLGALSNDFVAGSETLNCAPYQLGAIINVDVKLHGNATYTVREDYANSDRTNGVISILAVYRDNAAAAAANTNLSAATLEVNVKALERLS
ncbi:hypothetical protein [Rhodobacteraceae phage LS06-2018-MD06]|jgi:hypothetical protein|nr:hypothetical protein [Rhodobacteraceae phage LS06-2018-MD06]